jgi:hypothetical protein
MVVINTAQGYHLHVLLFCDGKHEIIRQRNFKPLPSSPDLRVMLEACAFQDDPDSYQEMIEDWKLDLSCPSN